jgi:hypothetical protein
MATSYLTFVAILFFVIVSPGPNLLLLLKNSSTRGRRVALWNTVGICAAILCPVVRRLEHAVATKQILRNERRELLRLTPAMPSNKPKT